ncbi:ABC-F family ATP-binding cassette domain-containing protein [Bacillus horti]|uniref:ATPase subunit of ABC transporter with duplicated ATPase domains n=1 Tax=Caldalkalibacillus horti TaxID=77523 RepID=A0ABT9W0X1_9BACI|nr:ABC-F family ATP-binding cassette domain-containing protein [Bacillus horti]MDQ0166900.1 ATPase subunit of ABC transporter with duplicated ATPase domains [Bacillus horti]
MSILDVEHITHTIADKTIFRNISFRLLAGEHVGLVGANGAGKSTLLRILCGDILPDAGRVQWISNVQVGHLEQHIQLKPEETILQFLLSAFSDLYKMESDMLHISEQMGQTSGKELDVLLKQFTDLQEALEHGDFYRLESKAEEVARGLGLTEIGLESRVDTLSGGQRTKLLLGKLLLQQPQVLLLDEPTNYLDTEHINWFKDYLKDYPNAFILISHDTDFMDAVVHLIYHLEHQEIQRYVGNHTQFLHAYELRKNEKTLAYRQQQAEIKKLETYIQKNKVRASTAKQAKSREKKLEKIERLDKPVILPRPRFSFPITGEPGETIMEARQLVVGYEQPLLPPLNLTLKRGMKVALIGYNGIGKSTSLKTILGHIPLLSGDVILGEQVKPAYFAQELHKDKSHPDDTHTAIEEVWHAFPHLTQREVRSALARCGLRSVHLKQSLASLSGGEQAKVRLCKLMLSDTNWLILDEPTNHLDLAAKDALREALIAYPGTILLVSHEPSFYQDWVTDVWDIEALINEA